MPRRATINPRLGLRRMPEPAGFDHAANAAEPVAVIAKQEQSVSVVEATRQGAGSGAPGTAYGQHLSPLDQLPAAVNPVHFIAIVSVQAAVRPNRHEATDNRRVGLPQRLRRCLRRAGTSLSAAGTSENP